jgi:hypothetical protein
MLRAAWENERKALVEEGHLRIGQETEIGESAVNARYYLDQLTSEINRVLSR